MTYIIKNAHNSYNVGVLKSHPPLHKELTDIAYNDFTAVHIQMLW
jgi:hypothetical protein